MPTFVSVDIPREDAWTRRRRVRKALDLRPNDIVHLSEAQLDYGPKATMLQRVNLLERVTARRPNFKRLTFLVARSDQAKSGADGSVNATSISKTQGRNSKRRRLNGTPQSRRKPGRRKTLRHSRSAGRRARNYNGQNDLQGALEAYRAQLLLTPKTVWWKR